jgi:hypothetical protein
MYVHMYVLYISAKVYPDFIAINEFN